MPATLYPNKITLVVDTPFLGGGVSALGRVLLLLFLRHTLHNRYLSG